MFFPSSVCLQVQKWTLNRIHHLVFLRTFNSKFILSILAYSSDFFIDNGHHDYDHNLSFHILAVYPLWDYDLPKKDSFFVESISGIPFHVIFFFIRSESTYPTTTPIHSRHKKTLFKKKNICIKYYSTHFIETRLMDWMYPFIVLLSLSLSYKIYI